MKSAFIISSYSRHILVYGGVCDVLMNFERTRKMKKTILFLILAVLSFPPRAQGQDTDQSKIEDLGRQIDSLRKAIAKESASQAKADKAAAERARQTLNELAAAKKALEVKMDEQANQQKLAAQAADTRTRQIRMLVTGVIFLVFLASTAIGVMIRRVRAMAKTMNGESLRLPIPLPPSNEKIIDIEIPSGIPEAKAIEMINPTKLDLRKFAEAHPTLEMFDQKHGRYTPIPYILQLGERNTRFD